MKVRLLKRIRKNLMVTRYSNGYFIEVKNSLFFTGAECRISKDESIIKTIRNITLFSARFNFKRKSKKLETITKLTDKYYE